MERTPRGRGGDKRDAFDSRRGRETALAAGDAEGIEKSPLRLLRLLSLGELVDESFPSGSGFRSRIGFVRGG